MEILKRILKDVLVAFVVLVVGVGFLALLDKIGLPRWPFLLFVFYFSVVAGSKKEALLRAAVGGLIGLVVGFAQPLAMHFTGNETVATVILAVLVIAVLAAYIDGKVRWVEGLCLLLMTVVTAIPGVAEAKAFLPAVGSFLVAAATVAVVVVLTDRATRKKVAQ